ncbi:hypothetical protein ISF_04990 [Cordyceps fumosorosea ARSEF 2679]|uniref:Uncharacterized protein n=1 Tax=Cordyceps fumosorosea (strain ARSEF 2679) TaxID=1081104 RepID=A0A167VY85_CORFA|nr:hypothetical protein ISF_04990 [Cordyceps fumosorosea ARSEF 2679]OAA63114.1 hypothetical protein ISF_04990 [Cordyceps fumosorosea ARSEF 2679]
MPKRTAQQVLHDEERVKEERMKELAEKLEGLSPAELQDFLQDLYSSMQEDTENPHGVWVNKEKSYIILELFYEEGCRHIRYDYKTETLADGPRAQTIYRRCLPPKPGDPVEFLAMIRHEMVDCVSLICKDAANVVNVTNAQQCVDTVTSCVYALYATSASITCEDEPFKSHWKKTRGWELSSADDSGWPTNFV